MAPPTVDGCFGNLMEQIQDSMVASISQHLFLPTDKLHEIFTLSAVQDAVRELKCGPDDRIKLADTIYHKGRRVFAMLIYNNCQDLIVDFRKHDALDSRLPLREDDAMKIMKPHIARRIAREFQWGFCPYTFPENMSACHCNIEQNMILPFIDNKHIGSGAFGDVDKVTVSPSQQNFDKEAKFVQVVRKRLKATGETEEFKREDTCLRLLNQLNHPNIIPLLGSYTYLDENNFLFPYFEMDLGSFLKAKTRHQDFQWDSTFYSALTGLASALSSTHHLLLNQAHHDLDFEAIGYHHDLRPPNVLIRPDTFVLADFGMGRLKQVEDPSHTPHKWTSGDYVAPENTDEQENPRTANRATDVWAFGCLLAEVVTYMLTGTEGVERFRHNRLTPGRLRQWKDARFYQPNGHVKKEVIDWMEALKRDNPHPDCAPLLVNLVLDILQADPQHRPDMRTIYQRLELLSMQKHFHTVQDKFREIREVVEISEPPFRHHLGRLRYAQERFELWGNTLTLGESNISISAQEQSESSVKIMKELLQALREELRRRHLGDESTLHPFASLIIHPVEELWKLLPTSLLQSAENQWEKKVMDSGLVQQIQDSHQVADGYLPAASMADPVDPLKSEFEEETRKFKDSLDDAVPLNEILKVTSVNDVYDITDKIQRNGLRNLPKMRIYLERLTGYASVITNIINGNQDVLALLWGSTAILLQLAEPLDKAFDSLLGTIAEVGKILPDFQVSASIFNQNIEAKEILILFFKDLLNFYGAALKFFSHSSWMHAFDRLWPKQYAYYLEVAGHIKRLTRLMRTEIRIGDIQQEDEFRKRALENFKAQTREARGQEFYRIMTSFNPCRYDTTLYRLRGLRCKGTGDWLFKDNIYVKWLNSSQEEMRILWLKGIPGAGKTVLSSAILDQLRGIQGTKTAFAFLTYQEAKTTALSTIHSLAFQLAERDEDLMAIFCESIDEGLKSDLNTAGNLLSSLARYAGSVYLVIDGVDEISEAERCRLVTELLRLDKKCENLRIIFSTRPEADLIRLLCDTAAVIHIHDHNEGSIYNYVDQRTKYIFGIQNIALHIQADIRKLLSPLASRAKGMFLFARLVMDMVENIQDMSELQEELAVLPESLDDAYHRIIVRLGNHKDKRTAAKARRLLGWVACSDAPITVEEAHQALIVMPGNRDQVFTMVAKLDVVNLLGPIVEIVDTYIRFVHFTAKEQVSYISSPHLGSQLIDTTQAALDLATQCINYLCQRHHDLDLALEERSEKVTTGQYSFHAFATRMWFELVCQHFQSSGAANPSAKLVKSIQILWDSRKVQDLHITAEDKSDVESDSEAIFETLKEKQPLLHQVLNRVSQFRNSSFLFTGHTDRDSNKSKHDPFSTSDMSQRIRQAFDKALCDSPTHWPTLSCRENCANILHYYGPRPFKCRFPGCAFWLHGFEKRVLRDRHERSHDKPLKCHVLGCEFEQIGFLSEKMRQDHLEQAHQSDPAQLSFEAKNLALNGVEDILRDLVKEDRVEDVQRVLSAIPNALKFKETRHQLRLLAASRASSDMLKLFEDPGGGGFDTGNEFWVLTVYIAESIRGRNESTLMYFMSSATPYPRRNPDNDPSYGHMENNDLSHRDQTLLISQMISSDWLEGVKVWSNWVRSRRDFFCDIIIKEVFGHKLVLSATSNPAKDQLLLLLWRDSGIIHLFDKISASQTLRPVAEFSSSITLARFLLDQGADINYQPRTISKTALHYAVMKSSARRAEMIRFLLLNGANPETYYIKASGPVDKRVTHKIRDEVGATDIYQWLGKTWDELVEEAKAIRHANTRIKGKR